MTDGWWAGLTGLAVAVLTAAGSTVVMLIKARHQARQEEVSATMSEYRLLIADQKEELKLFREQLRQQEVAIEAMREENASCEVEMAIVWGWLERFHDLAVGHVASLKKLNQDVPDVPPLPPRRKRPTGGEFLARTARQNTRLIREIHEGPGNEGTAG